ncbi:MAG: DNA polymerase III subunit alpha [Pseudomonadota bacterium]|nr:DNA polymerase III subunit alpha [Pseudomonadota bacterium]
MAAFVHLALHTEFSVVDGLVRIEALAERAKEMGFPAVAVTDLGNLFGMLKFYKACRNAGVKPIVGLELDMREEERSYRLIVLVADQTGYQNLLKLVSRSYIRSHDRGTFRKEWLEELNEGLILLSGGRGGDVGIALINDEISEAFGRAEHWKNVFPNRYYIELSRTGRRDEDQYIGSAVGLAESSQIPVVATNDVRFLDPQDFEAHEARVCIQEGRTLNDPRRERRFSDQQYLRSADEMAELFADIPEAIENAYEISRRCNLLLDLDTYHLPIYPVPEETTLEELLTSTAHEALEHYFQHASSVSDEMDRTEYLARLDYELGVINQMGFAGYFLIVMEFVNWAKQRKIPVGPGRGSGAASLVSFCLGITDLDPLRYDLLFERLLNPERVSMPDLDIDFCMERRDEVINHVAELYGDDAVSQIATFGTMAAKAVVRDVARVQGKPYGLADRLSKMIPFEVGMTLNKAVSQEEELRELIDENDEVAEIMDMAYPLEGLVRNVGRHAGGVVIAPSALEAYVPLYTETLGAATVSQYDKDDVEAVGLVKFDFLGLKTLTIIDWALTDINQSRLHRGEEPIDIREVSLDDDPTYELLRSAETTAIFQLESEGMKDLIRRLLPDNINDVIALVALFRPGPLQSGAVDDYISRKHDRASVHYPHPRLESVLSTTYGVMLYQEDVMSVSQELAGFSLGQADLLRKAMGKKIPEEMANMRATFLEGTAANEVDETVANAIFDQMEKFAGYAFNKAHSAAYAMLSFQTAWLKTHYPAEFMAAVLSADMQNIDKVVMLVDETSRMGIRVSPPDVNQSDFKFRAVEGSIVYGLGAVRGIGEGPVNAITSERKRGDFVDLQDFCNRVDLRRANKKVIEALVRSGSMDGLAPSKNGLDQIRAELLSGMQQSIQGAEQSARDRSFGMQDMFGGVEATTADTTSRRVRAMDTRTRLEGEKETLGLYLTGHPIDDYIDEIRTFCPKKIAQLRSGQRGQTIAGLVVSHRSRRSKRGEGMAFVILDDQSGRVEVSVFGEIYAEHHSKLTKDAVLIVEGTVQPDEYSGDLKVRAEAVYTVEEARGRFRGQIEISTCEQEMAGDFPNRLREKLEVYRAQIDSPRGCEVTISYQNEDATGRVVLGEDWRVQPSDQLLASLREEFGANAVCFRYST